MLTVEQVVNEIREGYCMNAYWIDESMDLIRSIQDIEIMRERLQCLEHEYNVNLAKYKIMKNGLAQKKG